MVCGEGSAGAKFERLNEAEEIASGRRAFDEEVDVVGHETVGMDGEISSGGGFAQEFENAVAESRVGKAWPAAMAAERYEDSDLADIVFEFEANCFTEVH